MILQISVGSKGCVVVVNYWILVFEYRLDSKTFKDQGAWQVVRELLMIDLMLWLIVVMSKCCQGLCQESRTFPFVVAEYSTAWEVDLSLSSWDSISS